MAPFSSTKGSRPLLLAPLLLATSLAAPGCGGPEAGQHEAPYPATLAIVNASGGAIECRAALAHWRSAELGRAELDGVIEVKLLIDPSDGSVLLAGPLGPPIPVEMLWCGAEGQSWTTRAILPLPREAKPGERIVRRCQARGDAHLSCH